MPYLYSCSVKTSREGLPLMRAMVFEFPEDPSTAYLDRQYMLGSGLLAAPIFSENGIVNYYLPKGKWTNIISGEPVEGGSWKTEKHGYFSLPLLARPNSIIPMGNNCSRPDYDYSDGLVFHVFELDDNKSAVFEFCDSSGNIEGRLEVSRQKNKITAVREGVKKPWSLCLRNIHGFSAAGNTEPRDSKEGLLLEINGDKNQVAVEL